MPIAFMPREMWGGLTGIQPGLSALAQGVGARYSPRGRTILGQMYGDTERWIDPQTGDWAWGTPRQVRERAGQLYTGFDPESGAFQWTTDALLSQPGYQPPPGPTIPSSNLPANNPVAAAMLGPMMEQMFQQQMAQQNLTPQLPTPTMGPLRYEQGGPVNDTRPSIAGLLNLMNIDRRRGEVPAVLHEGEFVMNRDATQAIGPQTLQQLNQLGQQMPRYQSGGMVTLGDARRDITENGGTLVKIGEGYYIVPRGRSVPEEATVIPFAATNELDQNLQVSRDLPSAYDSRVTQTPIGDVDPRSADYGIGSEFLAAIINAEQNPGPEAEARLKAAEQAQTQLYDEQGNPVTPVEQSGDVTVPHEETFLEKFANPLLNAAETIMPWTAPAVDTVQQSMSRDNTVSFPKRNTGPDHPSEREAAPKPEPEAPATPASGGDIDIDTWLSTEAPSLGERGKDWDIVPLSQLQGMRGWEIDPDQPAFQQQTFSDIQEPLVVVRNTGETKPAPASPPSKEEVQSTEVTRTGGEEIDINQPAPGPADNLNTQRTLQHEETIQRPEPQPEPRQIGLQQVPQAPGTNYRPYGSHIPVDFNAMSQLPPEQAMQYMYDLAASQGMIPHQGVNPNTLMREGGDPRAQQTAEIFNQLMGMRMGGAQTELTQAQAQRQQALGRKADVEAQVAERTLPSQINLTEASADLAQAQVRSTELANQWESLTQDTRNQMLDAELTALQNENEAFADLNELNQRYQDAATKKLLAETAALERTEQLNQTILMDPSTAIQAVQAGYNIENQVVDNAARAVDTTKELFEQTEDEVARERYLEAVLYHGFLTGNIPMNATAESLASEETFGIFSGRRGETKGIDEDQVNRIRQKAAERQTQLRALQNPSTYLPGSAGANSQMPQDMLSQLYETIQEMNSRTNSRGQ